MAGQLRITGGKLSRRHFFVPKAADQGLVRPASDRARAAIFSSLGTFVEGQNVLDLFAGSGAYGFESISRGAQQVWFVEKDKETAACISKNTSHLGLDTSCRVWVFDATLFTQRQVAQPFGLVFVDPPYPLKLTSQFWEHLKPWLLADSIVIYRCDTKESDLNLDGYEVLRDKNYGGTRVYFLRLK